LAVGGSIGESLILGFLIPYFQLRDWMMSIQYGNMGNDQEKRMEEERKTKAPEAKTSGAQKRFCLASLDSII
jgi:hypothetical protein